MITLKNYIPVLLFVLVTSTLLTSTTSLVIITMSTAQTPKLITISEKVWRTAAATHRQRIKSLLQPGLTSQDNKMKAGNRYGNQVVDEWTNRKLDTENPIYNFLVEYYGIKGSKGPRRLARWSPDPSLLLSCSTATAAATATDDTDADEGNANEKNRMIGDIHIHMDDNSKEMKVDDTDDTDDIDDEGNANEKNTMIDNSKEMKVDDQVYKAAMEASFGFGGILLQNANEDDMGGTLHLRGSTPVISNNENSDTPTFHGILYNPALFYNRQTPITTHEQRQHLLKAIAPFQWYSSILQTTLDSEPIFHCHGLHEWAMQYHPDDAPPPPSAKYQSSLPLRVSRQVINETVERKGISCTHVDALRFFAPAAGPLNHHGSELERMDQLRLEQKGCVHAGIFWRFRWRLGCWTWRLVRMMRRGMGRALSRWRRRRGGRYGIYSNRRLGDGGAKWLNILELRSLPLHKDWGEN